MDNREIEEKLAEFEQDSETVSLLLKDGSHYEGTIERELFTSSWRLRTSALSFLSNMRQDAIEFEVDDVDEVEPVGYLD
ncbi:MAG TPA: hypothetical protein VIT23_04770 [Terrimicrobiaceae bacterium]